MNTRSLRFRITAWYAGLLAGTLIVFGVSVYLGLERYLDWTLQGALASECRTIGIELLSQLPVKDNAWLATEINEAYAPEVNSRFIRVVHQGVGVVYLSSAPKDGTFDPARIPLPSDQETDGPRKLLFDAGNRLLILSMTVRAADGSRFLVESGAPYNQIEVALHGLLLTLAIYMPFVVSLAVAGGYWLMRRSLQPVDEITRRAEGITSTNLSERLPVVRSGDELERLSVSLNHMISRLEDAIRGSKQFVADASHELRTPLTVMRGELEAMAQDAQLGAETREALGSVLEEVDRLADIVEGLFALSRLDAGEAHAEWVRFDLAELAATTADQMSLLAEDKQVSVACDSPAGVTVQGDRARLKQVVVNLLDNAIKYTPRGGRVSLTVRREGGYAVLDVTDNGIGIPADALGQVFKRFYRVDGSRSREGGGAGLGLSIVKSICVAHGAEVEVRSAPGAGSTFRIRQPLAAEGSL